ncbi:MAG: radical SAM protein [Clostridium sp.]
MEFIKAGNIVSSYIDNNPWFGLNYTMNIYRGCNHGCIYCDSRSNCYNIIDFDTVRAKEDSAEIIENDLKKKRKKGVIGTGAMSDPYNSFEKKYELTRNALKIIEKYRFGVSIATKSSLIIRDIDILKRIQENAEVLIKITITSIEDEVSKVIEPGVDPSSERFKAVKELSDNGIYVGILFMPILPFINDTEENVRGIVKKAYESGAKFIYTHGIGVTLRNNQRVHYYEKLKENYNKDIVKMYEDVYGEDYICPSPKHEKLMEIFRSECEKYNILYRMKDIIEDYRKNYDKTQISFF